MCGFNRNREGDWSDSAVVTNTDRTQQTIELIDRIEMLEKKLEIAVDCLLMINATKDFEDADSMRIAYAIKQIEELDNGN